MKIVISVFFIFQSVLLFSQKISEEEMILGLSKIWKEMEYNFAYYSKFDKNNLDSLYISSIKQILKKPDDNEYYKILSKFTGTFNDGHTNIVKPPELKTEKGILLYPTVINNKIYVTGIGKKYKKKIPLGSQILTINNIEACKYMDEYILPFYSFPKHIKYHWLAKYIFYNKIGTSYKVKLQTLKNKIKIVEIKIDGGKDKWDEYHFSYKRYNKFTFKKLDNNIAYINFGTSLTYNSLKDFESVIDSLKNTSAIIFDLRNNTGGVSIGTEICKYLTKDSTFINNIYEIRYNNAIDRAYGSFFYEDYKDRDKNNNEITEYLENYTNKSSIIDTGIIYNDKDIVLEQPLIILTNNQTASAAESFLITLKNIGRGTIIGQKTFGSTCQPLIVKLPLSGYAKICTQKLYYADGRKYSYTKPDIEIIPTIEDVLNEKDVVLEAAINFIKKKVK